MKVAFPERPARVVSQGVIYPYSSSALLRNVEEAGSTAAPFGIPTILPPSVHQRPVILRIFAKVRRDEERIFAYIIGFIDSTLEHGKAHVEIIGARRGELDLVSNLVPMFGGRLNVKRAFLGSGCIGPQDRVAQETGDGPAVVHPRKPNSGRVIGLGAIVLALQNEIGPCIGASAYHVFWILHRDLGSLSACNSHH